MIMKHLQVNGETVSSASIEQEYRQIISELKLENQPLPNDKVKLILQDRARQNVIDHYLCKQEARKQGMKVDPLRVEEQVQMLATRNGGIASVEKYLSEIGETLDDLRQHIEDRLLVDKLVEKIHAKAGVPKDRHAKKFYKEHKEQFITEEAVEVRWFVKHYKGFTARRQAMEECQKVATSVRAGKSMRTLVKQRSDEPENDGLLGFVRRGELAAEFDDYVFSHDTGEISDPIEKDGTFYLLYVGEKREQAEIAFEEAKEQILAQLLQEQRKEALTTTIEKLRSKAKIVEI